MLSSIVKEHQAKQIVKKEIQEAKRKEGCAAADKLTHVLVDHLNVGVAQAYLNQKKLDLEAKQLHSSAISFFKQTQQWLNLVDSFSGAIKELGDVENWARIMEEDLGLITSALEVVYKNYEQENNE